jgi:hypothetical protein
MGASFSSKGTLVARYAPRRILFLDREIANSISHLCMASIGNDRHTPKLFVLYRDRTVYVCVHQVEDKFSQRHNPETDQGFELINRLSV